MCSCAIFVVVKRVAAHRRRAPISGAAHIRIAEFPKIMGDKAMLRQVWGNQIANALKSVAKRERPENWSTSRFSREPG